MCNEVVKIDSPSTKVGETRERGLQKSPKGISAHASSKGSTELYQISGFIPCLILDIDVIVRTLDSKFARKSLRQNRLVVTLDYLSKYNLVSVEPQQSLSTQYGLSRVVVESQYSEGDQQSFSMQSLSRVSVESKQSQQSLSKV